MTAEEKRIRKNAEWNAGNKKRQEKPGFCEKRNARNRAAYRRKKNNPAFLERKRVRDRAAYSVRMTKSNFRMRRVLRSRLQMALEGKIKAARTLVLLGCSIEFLCENLEKQFQPGMTWENYGPVWHVDHILPCSAFHLQHSEEQEICFNWSNLQPLFAKDNILKGDKIL